jgi:polyhydroxybutyrate depolymerase
MKKIIPLILFSILYVVANAQWLNKGFTFQGNNRVYRVYVPAMYNADNPASLVLTLHGLGDNITNFSLIGMNLIADTANIIVVVPQAMTDPLASTAWNSGAGVFGYYPNSAIDDVSFISALIDTVSTQYIIDSEKVFCCGFSMGGFMTQRLACELNDKIKVFASVAGTFGSGLPPCTPDRAVSVAHFHGTSDATVPYNGPQPGIAATALADFWVNNNACNTMPVESTFPDYSNDGFTVDHFVYSEGEDNTRVELFRVNGADHVWLTPVNDIWYTGEIWNFFNSQQIPTTGVIQNVDGKEMNIYPNPVSDRISVNLPEMTFNESANLKLTDLTGKVLYVSPVNGNSFELSLKELSLKSGFYILTFRSGGYTIAKKIIYTKL